MSVDIIILKKGMNIFINTGSKRELRTRQNLHTLAEIKPMLNIQLDLTRPVDEIVLITNAVLANRQDIKKEILQELDIQVGNALSEILIQEKNENQVSEEGGDKVGQSGNGNVDDDKQSVRTA